MIEFTSPWPFFYYNAMIPGNSHKRWTRYIVEEWLLLLAVAGLALTSFYAGKFPAYNLAELQVLFLLFVLFVVVRGLEHSGFVSRLSGQLERGRWIPLKLTLGTFFLSMLVTNDVALTVIVPLTLMLAIERKDVLVILEALAANAGSALTPIGSPQNLYIYWFYRVDPGQFIISMAKFSLPYLVLLVLASLLMSAGRAPNESPHLEQVKSAAYVYGGFLLLVILTVLRVLPVAWSGVVIGFAIVFDRRSLRVDYALLLTFLCFFGLADNVRTLMTSRLEHGADVFFASAISSQFMSNVPATLLFAKFTAKWNALLWGVNVGGFGSLLGSLANLIAYKFCITHKGMRNPTRFTMNFLGMSYAAFLVGVVLYFSVGRIS